MRLARAAASALACLTLCAPAEAQDGVQAAADALREATVEGCADLPRGAVAIRVSTELGDGAPDPRGLAPAIVPPTVEALRTDERFAPVHRAGFGRDGAAPTDVAARLGYATLIDVHLREVGAQLVLEGAVHTTADGARVSSFRRRVPLDLALRRFVGFPPLLADDEVGARSVRLPGNTYVAFAVGDLDGDGRPELVAARRGEAHVVRLAGRRVEVVGRAPFPAELPRATSPPRRAVGTARFANGRVVIRISDYAAPVAVRLVDGRPVAEVASGPCADPRFPMQGGCAALVVGRDFFDEELTGHDAPWDEASAHFYAYAFGSYPARDGTTTDYEAVVSTRGRLALRMRHTAPREGQDPEITDRSVGAVGYGLALAMGDLDLDGTAELLVSHAAPAGGGDQLTLMRALPRGAVRVMWRGDAIGGSVWLATSADADGDGRPEMLAIEEPSAGRGRAALWIVR